MRRLSSARMSRISLESIQKLCAYIVLMGAAASALAPIVISIFSR